MSNVFRAEELADGHVAATTQPIFTATADVATYVKHLTLYNNNAVTQTIILKYRPVASGALRFWRRFVLAQDESVDAIDGGEAIILPNGSKIEAITTTASVVDYRLDGIEESTT